MKKRLVFIVGVLFLIGFVSGTDYYVDFDIGTNGDGSVNNPWNNWADAKKSGGIVNDGDIVYLFGTDTGNSVTFSSFDSGSYGNVITYKERPGYSFVKDGTGKWQYAVYIQGSNIVFDGWKIQNWPDGGFSFWNSVNSDQITISNCFIHDLDGYAGIATTTGNVSNLLIEDCTIFNIGTDASHHGIYISDCDNCVIRNCNIYNAFGNAIQVQARSPDNHYINNLTIEKCKLHDSGAGIYFGDYAGLANLAKDLTIKNNLIYSNTNWGIKSYRQSLGNQIYQNTIWNNGGQGIWGHTTDTSLIVRNNILFQNLLGNIVGPMTESNNLITDPSFISTLQSSTDFLKLSSNSPAIDQGYDLSGIVDEDYFGTLRPQDGDNDGTAEFDIGAYEYLSSCIPTRHPSDTDCDDLIDITELMTYINQWKNNEVGVTISTLFDALVIWKKG